MVFQYLDKTTLNAMKLINPRTKNKWSFLPPIAIRCINPYETRLSFIHYAYPACQICKNVAFNIN